MAIEAEAIEIDEVARFNAVVARNVLFFREERGLSQEALAEKAALKKITISRIETQSFKKRVDEFYLRSTAGVLGVEVDALTETNSEVERLISYLNVAAYELPQTDEVVSSSERLMKLSEKQGPIIRAYAYMYRGLLHYYQGKYGAATEYYEEASRYSEKSFDQELHQRVIRNLASGCMMIGMFQRAEGLILRTLKSSDSKEKKARDLFKLATLYNNQDLHDKAEKTFHDALGLLAAFKNNIVSGWCHQGIGSIHRVQKRFDSATFHTLAALESARNCNDLSTVIYSLRTLGEIHRDQGDFHLAKQMFEEGISVSKGAGRKYDELAMRFEISILASSYIEMKEIINQLETIEAPIYELSLIYESAAEKAYEQNLIDDVRVYYRKANEHFKKK